MYEEGWNNGERWYNGGRWDGLGMEANDTKILEKIKCNEPHLLVHSVCDST
jgi:hypothetical protein